MIKPLGFGLAVLFFALGAPYVSSWWVGQQVERHIGVEFEGKLEPSLLASDFYVRDIRLLWNERVELHSGDLKVDYSFFDMLGGMPIRIQLSAEEVGVKLLDDWADIQGVEDVVLDRFYADVVIGRDGLEEVYSVLANSPSLNFEINANG